MGEHLAAGAVADGVDAGGVSLAVFVDGDKAAGVEGDTSFREAETGDAALCPAAGMELPVRKASAAATSLAAASPSASPASPSAFAPDFFSTATTASPAPLAAGSPAMAATPCTPSSLPATGSSAASS